MSWLGLGFIASHSLRLSNDAPAAPVAGRLTPSAQWTGVAGSGFASAPVDPVRTTAKPALRLIVPDNQHFTSTLDVIVVAAANDSGTLGADWGILNVRFHYEGNSETISAPAWHSVSTERGPRMYFGWKATLSKPATTRGSAQLYIEATAKDATMQKRVMGPYLFSPVNSLHDLALAIAPSQPVIAGSRYQTLHAAIAYARTQNAQNPLFTATEAGVYTPDGPTIAPAARNITGRYTFRASVPDVTFGKSPDYVYTGDDLTRKIDSQQTWWHVAGSNITIDMKNASNLASPVLDRAPFHWIDGARVTSSDPRGKNELHRGRPPLRQAQLFEGQCWLTEVVMDRVSTPFYNLALARGCVGTDIAQDIFSNSLCVVHCSVSDHDQTFFNADTPAFTVVYSGAETTATLARNGSNLGFSTTTIPGLWTAVIGSTTYTFDTGQASVDYYNGTPPGGYNGASAIGGYTAGDVIDWLNTLPDVTATLTPGFERDELIAAALSLPGIKGQGFGPGAAQPGNITPLNMRISSQIVWNINTHGDFYQHAAGRLENVIMAFTTGHELHTQPVFLSPILKSGVASTRDVFFIGVSHCNDETISDDFDFSGSTSSFKRAQELGHVVFAHCTFANSGMLVNTAEFVDEGYSLITNCSFERFVWLDDVPLAGMTIQNSGMHDEAITPSGLSNVFKLGSNETLYPGRLTGDFAPSALARTVGFPPVIASDASQTEFPALAAVGAVSAVADALYIPPEPGDNLGPQGDAMAALLSGKANSGMWFHEDAQFVDGNFAWPSITGGLGNFFNQTASRIPGISATDGIQFKSTQDTQIVAVATGTFTVMILMRKNPAEHLGYPVQNNPARLYADSGVGLTQTYVDGVLVANRRAFRDALNGGPYRSVRIPSLVVNGELQIGRTSSSMWADVLGIVVLDQAEFGGGAVTAAIAQANSWFTELKP